MSTESSSMRFSVHFDKALSHRLDEADAAEAFSSTEKSPSAERGFPSVLLGGGDEKPRSDDYSRGAARGPTVIIAPLRAG